MSLFKKPSELEVKTGIVAMIYGSPGSGKTTLACSAPGAVLIDTDRGVMRINGGHMVPTLQVERWEQILQALEELKQDTRIETVIIDTVGKMMAYMEDYIKRTASGKRKEIKADGSLSLQGFGVRKTMFINLINSLTLLGKNVIFVAHDKEDKRGDDTVIRPEVGGSSTNDLMKELDIVGYMEINGNQRTISFTPTDRYYAKNTCDMPGVIAVPVLVDENGSPTGTNNFMQGVIAKYHERVERNIGNNRRLEELKEEIRERASQIENAEGANEFAKWVEGLEHVYNSKAIAGVALLERVKALGLQYDKSTKTYSDGEGKL